MFINTKVKTLKNIFSKTLFFFLLPLLFTAGCKKEERTGWDTELLVPIATSTLSLNNIVKDSALVVNSEGYYTLSYKSSLFSFNLADQIINIPDTSIGQKFTLDSLQLPNQSVKFLTSLGFLATNMLTAPDVATQFLGQFLLAQNGNTTVVPALNASLLNTATTNTNRSSEFFNKLR